MNPLPGIFNDIIGPVMRGPSSSHTAASWRIARTSLEILNEPLRKATIQFDRDGAWAPNYREQGTAMGINGGLLGLDITDDKMKDTDSLAHKSGIAIIYEIDSFPTNHSNTVRLILTGSSGRRVRVVAVSTGGGSFEIREIDKFQVLLRGDCYSILIHTRDPAALQKEFNGAIPEGVFREKPSPPGHNLLQWNAPEPFDQHLVHSLQNHREVDELLLIQPLLPVVSGNGSAPPFSDVPSALEYARRNQVGAGQLGLIYEQHMSGMTGEKLMSTMEALIVVIDQSIATGLAGTRYGNRILQQQSHLVEKASDAGSIPSNSLVNRIIANVSAIMESKSGMEVIVANPTAGSCGTVGGVLRALADEFSYTPDEVIDAYFAAGLIGVFFAQGPGFSAEEHGCQVECGAAAGMAAAGIVQLYKGSATQAINAASLAIQNMIGLVCDPVADRVEVPCLGKNISAAMNALASATMACSGFDAVIPLEETIQTIAQVSRQMPACVKCTGKGGLAVTPAAIKLRNKLAGS